MARDIPPAGAVLRYPYLWLQQSRRGEESGRKDRPVCLVMAVHDPKADLHHLAFLAISSQEPRPDQEAIEIPDIERKRAGLTGYPQAWVYVSEWNYDIAERSFYLDPLEPIMGTFTPRFLSLVARAFMPTLKQSARRISRS
jgi:hypothetical protein